MITYKKILKEVEETVDVTCDICGKTCKDSIDLNFEFLFLHTSWGYGSGHDDEKWEAQICEKCTVEKLEPLIKFQKTEYFPFE